MTMTTVQQQTQTQLVYLYRIMTAFCCMMVVWILFIPGSMFHGRSTFHDTIVAPKLGDDHSLVPPTIVRKYVGQTLVHLTHILPSAIWSAIIPFQLHRGFLKAYPTIHRYMGYIFFVATALVAMGVIIIVDRGLLFEKMYENDNLPPNPVPIPTEWVLYIMTTYFVGTAVMAWKRAAIDHSYRSHQTWMIRHVGSGLWIAVQRVALFVVFAPIYGYPVPKETQRNIFGQAAQVGWIISVSTAEYAIYLLNNSSTIKITNNSTSASSKTKTG